MTSLSRSGRSFATASPISHPRLSPISHLLPVLLLLLGAGFRIHGVVRTSHFHADEALFASFARRLVLEGDWNLDRAPVDKPPTTFFIVGISLAVWGENEFAARLPNVFASLIGLAAFYALTRRCTGRRLVATIALLLFALSPIEIGYAPTVFQDTPTLAALLVGTWLVAGQRWGNGGLASGMAVACKPTGLWLLPLIVGIGAMQRLIASADRLAVYRGKPCSPVRGWFGAGLKSGLAFMGGFFTPVVLVVMWDKTRHAQSFIELGNYNNNPGRLIRAEEIKPRAEIWLNLLAGMAARPWLAVIFLFIALLWLGISACNREPGGLISWLITLFLIWYMGIYWLVAFNTWDRYILPVTPFALLLVAQGVGWLLTRLTQVRQTRYRMSLAIIMAILLVISWNPAAQAVHRSNPPGVNGIDELADTLNRDFAGQIVYDHWLGWYLLWYLGPDPAVQVIYFPTPEDLACHLQHATTPPYFATPGAALAYPWLEILGSYGVTAEPVYHTQRGDFVVYRLHPPGNQQVVSLSAEARCSVGRGVGAGVPSSPCFSATCRPNPVLLTITSNRPKNFCSPVL
jgi:hypothetical protein